MIKIILNNKRIFLAEDHRDIIRQFHLNNAYIIFDLHEQKVLDLVDMLLLSSISDAIFVGNINDNMAIVKNALTLVRAGGGVVFNNRNELLFIYRRRKWDLPKGKMDRRETIEKCATREVYEETGVRNLEIVRELDPTYHIYLENSVILKETIWFLMFTEDVKLRPQFEEGIKKAIWVHKNNIRYQLRNTYPSVVDIFEKLLSES